MKHARFACTLLMASLAGVAQAQAYPSRTVRMLVPLAPGGSMDTIARALSQRMTESMGHNVVVDNRPGAGSSIAIETAQSAPADGHTLIVLSSTVVIFPILYKARYDVLRDFVPVSQITAQAYITIVHPSIPARNVPELVRLLRAHPGKLNFASSGIGTPIHLAGELFMLSTGTRMTHVPYKGMGTAYADLIAGNIEMSFPTIVSSQGHIRSGKLRALAVTGPQRAPALPEVPTLAEAGVKDVVVTNWYGIAVIAGTPAAIVERINREVVQAIRHPDMAKRLVADGSEAIGGSPDEFRAHIVAERDKLGRVIKLAGIRGQ